MVQGTLYFTMLHFFQLEADMNDSDVLHAIYF